MLATPLAVAAWPTTEAEAFSNRVAQFPNGDCDHCHVFPGGPRTAFGLDVARTLQNGAVNWSALFSLDSDGDGFTNGEELGDPFGQWQRGNPDPDYYGGDPAYDNIFPTPFGNAPVLQDVTVTVEEDGTYTGTVTAEDADGDDLYLRVVAEPEYGTLDFDAETGEFTYTPDANYDGDDSFAFQAWDGRNISGEVVDALFVADPGVITIDITPVNDLPEITTEGDQTVNENGQLFFSVSGEDLEDGDVTLGAVDLPEGATFDPDTGFFNWQPNYFQSGVYTISFTATDNDQGVATEEVEIEVINVNRPPEIEEIGGTLEGQEGDALTLSAVAVDLDNEELTYTWNFGDNSEPVSGVGLSEVTHTFVQDGDFTVLLTVSDGTDSDFDTIEVVLTNVLPVVEAGQPQTAPEGTPVALVGSFVDPGINDNHDYLWEYGDGGTNDNLEVNHAYGDDGTYTASLTVFDDDGQGEDSVQITITNVAPVANAGGDRTIDEGTPYTFDGQFEDPGFDDEHTYLWNLGDGQTNTNRQATHTYADQGTFTVSFQVSDDDGGTDTDTISVQVNNVAPSVVSEPPLYAILEELYEYQIEAFDPGDDTISYTFITGPDGMEMDEGGRITYTPPEEEQDNVYTVTVNVSDEDGGVYEHSWELLVGLPDRDGDGASDECEEQYNRLDPDDPTDGPLDFDNDGLTNAYECQNGTNPIVSNAPNAPSINRPFDGQLVNTPDVSLSVNNSIDPDGDRVTYFFALYSDAALTQTVQEWEQVSEGDNITTVDVIANLTEDGAYYWRVRAYDGNGYSPYSDVAQFRYSLFNDAPSIPQPLSPIGIVQINPVIFSVSEAIDPEDELPVTYDFQVFNEEQVLHDSALSIPGRGPQVQWVSTVEYEENATYTWRVRANDVRGISSVWSDYQTIQINQVNSPPPTPSPLAPDQGATVNNPVGLRFVADGVEDEDGDVLSYTFRLATENTFAPNSIVAQSEPMPAGPGDQAAWALPQEVTLEENRTYYWDVRAYDGEAYSPQAIRSFLFSVENEAPLKVTVQSPADGVNLTVTDPTFSWINVSDPEGSPVTYILEVYGDERLGRRLRRLEGIEPTGVEGDLTEANVQPLEDEGGAFWWRVRAVDADDQRGEWSDVAGFTISVTGEPPTAPVVLDPKDDQEFTFGDEVVLTWENATDDQGAALVYTVEVLNGAGALFTSQTVDEDASGTTSATVSLALAPGDYSWRVQANDGELDSPWSDSGTFKVAEVVAPPQPTQTSGCAQAPAERPAGPGGLAMMLALLALGFVIRRR